MLILRVKSDKLWGEVHGELNSPIPDEGARWIDGIWRNSRILKGVCSPERGWAVYAVALTFCIVPHT